MTSLERKEEEMDGPTLEEMKRYWKANNALNKCHGCPEEGVCWAWRRISYKPETMQQTCDDPEILDALATIEEMTEDKPLGFYAIKGDWWGCEELWEIME